MFKKMDLAMTLMGLFTPAFSVPAIAADMPRKEIKQGKGQLRDAKPKSSGAAQFKRVAKKKNNIRKHG